ncbi:hypothetical protein BDR07DRAFT_1484012 [Suillus spraguei]|nr:hypothetical protein BDR07DRAFT_1484012 [Suillus spraguei]
MMYINFGNQIATLDDIIQSDIEELKRQKKNINIKEWTVHAGEDQTGVPQYIMVSTEQFYAQAMQGKRAQVMKKYIDNANGNMDGKKQEAQSSTSTGIKGNMHEATITTNTFYNPTTLPDYGGDIFQHENAKLQQLDIRDEKNELIPPQDWYSSLR